MPPFLIILVWSISLLVQESIGLRRNLSNSVNQTIAGAAQKYNYSNNTCSALWAMFSYIFDAERSDFNNFFNDWKIRRKKDQITLAFDYYRANQNINMSRLRDSHLLNVKREEAELLDFMTFKGANTSQNESIAYKILNWANLHRNDDTNDDQSTQYLVWSIPLGEKCCLAESFEVKNFPFI